MDKVSFGIQTGLRLAILLPVLPKAWDYGCVKPCLANSSDSGELGREEQLRCGYSA